METTTITETSIPEDTTPVPVWIIVGQSNTILGKSDSGGLVLLRQPPIPDNPKSVWVTIGKEVQSTNKYDLDYEEITKLVKNNYTFFKVEPIDVNKASYFYPTQSKNLPYIGYNCTIKVVMNDSYTFTSAEMPTEQASEVSPAPSSTETTVESNLDKTD